MHETLLACDREFFTESHDRRYFYTLMNITHFPLNATGINRRWPGVNLQTDHKLRRYFLVMKVHALL